MTEETEIPDNNPQGITRHPLYNPTLAVYWIFVSAMLLKILGAFIGFWDYPVSWLYYLTFGPALAFVFYAILEDVIEDAVYEGTRRAMIELLEHMDDELPTEEDHERIAELYNSEPAGRA